MTPKTIFKYEPFNLRAVQNFKASSIYFGSPANFNDPYDCALTASIAPVEPAELEALKEECLTSTAYPEEVRREIPSLTNKEFEDKIRRGAQLVLDRARDDFLSSNGVTCFSETNDNLLMWSHYGGQHKGYCLEFDTEHEPFNKLKIVNYVESMPQFELSDFIRNKNHSKILELFCTKSSAWEYEKEWRALHGTGGTQFSYAREALKGVFFGPDISNQDRDLLCIICHAQFPDAELWIGSRSATEFRVEFVRLSEYIPYNEARKRGMA